MNIENDSVNTFLLRFNNKNKFNHGEIKKLIVVK